MVARTAYSLLIGTCFVGNVLGTILLFNLRLGEGPEQICYGVGGGLILGQVVLLAIWCVLGGEPLVIRLPRALALSVLVLCSWLIAASWADNGLPFEVSIVVSGLAMLLFLIITGPLWVVRGFSPCRIVPQNQIGISSEQFSLRHVLVYIAIVAVLTALGKWIVQHRSSEVIGMPPLGFLISIIGIVAAISVLVSAAGMPMAWGVLSKQPSRRPWIAILLILCCGPPLLNELLYIMIGQQPDFLQRAWGILAWYGFAVAAAAITGGGLLLSRALGFRLVSDRDLADPLAQ